jgi:molybdopterin-guanine dinucleotide biosynthesis protein A
MGRERHTEITGAVLAGGRGLRMGGLDKGLLDYRGKPLIQWALAALRPQVGPLLVVANRNHAAYARHCPHVYADDLPDFPGPLAGMLTALRHAPTELVLCVPVDVPALPADLAQRLRDAWLSGDAPGCSVFDGERAQPLVCLLHRRLAPSLQRALAQGMRKVREWQAQEGLTVVDFSDARAGFANLNTPAQLGDDTARPEHVSAHPTPAAGGTPGSPDPEPGAG